MAKSKSSTHEEQTRTPHTRSKLKSSTHEEQTKTPQTRSKSKSSTEQELPTTPDTTAKSKSSTQEEQPRTPHTRSKSKSKLKSSTHEEQTRTPQTRSKSKSSTEQEQPTTPDTTAKSKSSTQEEQPRTPHTRSKSKSSTQQEQPRTPQTRSKSKSKSSTQQEQPTTPHSTAKSKPSTQQEQSTTPESSTQKRQPKRRRTSTAKSSPQQNDERDPDEAKSTRTPVGASVNRDSENDRDLKKYLPLYKAALKGDWEAANNEFFKVDRHAVRARITKFKETALHVAAYAGHSGFAEEMVKLMEREDLELQNSIGYTALHYAAIAGNTNAVKAMVRKNSDLTQIPDDDGAMPVFSASNHTSDGKKETLWFLCTVTGDKDPRNCQRCNTVISNYEHQETCKRPFTGPSGARLIINIINSGFYDICLFLLQRHPCLATAQIDGKGSCMLRAMAQWPERFESGSQLGFWQRRIYSFIPVELEDASHGIKGRDEEDPPVKFGDISTTYLTRASQWLSGLLSKAMKPVPRIKQLQETKLTHKRTNKLLELVCQVISQMKNSEIYEFFEKTEILSTAAEYGTVEIIEKCIQSFPDILWITTKEKTNNGSSEKTSNAETNSGSNEKTSEEETNNGSNGKPSNEENNNESKGRYILHIAIEHRREKVFNLIYGLSGQKSMLANCSVEGKNYILHLAAKLAPYSQLNSVSGAALQMQRELQWYKKVEEILEPIYRAVENEKGKSPAVLFTEEHESLAEKGERWMKDTAQSCMVVATLIATVMFAAAFTVPGGNISDTNNSEKGIPIFLYKNSFLLFAISDALALFSSSTAVLMFLSILTSRYAEGDFLKSLPNKLIIGFATLFFSIATMMIAFCAALYIVLSQRLAMTFIPIPLFACFTVIVFLSLQLPLFVEICRSTYGSGIFESKKKLF